MVPGTIRLFGLWLVLSLISTPGIMIISLVFYELSLPFLANVSAWFWQSLFSLSSLELAITVAVTMTLKLCLWFGCYRRTFLWAGEVLSLRQDIQAIQESGLIARGRALVQGPLMAHHEKLIKRLNQWGRSTVFPISMGLFPFCGTASIASILLAAANARRKFCVLAVTNCAALFIYTFLFREAVVARLVH